MKIVICGSMRFSKEMLEVKEKLIDIGHEVILPKHSEEYAKTGISDFETGESTQNKIKNDLIRDYFKVINNSDAVLIVNQDTDITNYIGGNSFLEMGFAHALNKKIFILNNIPEMSYTDEIVAMQVIALNGDLSRIK